MATLESEVLEKVLAAFEVNPRDWLTVEDVARKTGLDVETVRPILWQYPGKFEQTMILRIPAFTLRRRPVSDSVHAGITQVGD